MKPVKLDQIAPYARNSRTHSAAQIAQIAASLEQFGMVGAIVVREGTLAKGHGTLKAVQSLYAAGKRLYPAPGQAQGAKPYPPGTVPVLDVTGWSDTQFRAYVIADNQLANNAGWDVDILLDEITQLDEDGFDLDILGFDAAQLDQLEAKYHGAPDEIPLDANNAGQGDDDPQEDDDKPGKAAPIRVPVMMELSPAQNARWRELKKALGTADNTAAFLHYTGIQEKTA